jgi:hypothetical protein
VLAERGDVEQAMHYAREAVPLLRLSERMWAGYDCLSFIAVLRGEFDLAFCLHRMSDTAYAVRGFSAREPNEARLHSRVAQVLREQADDFAMRGESAIGRAVAEGNVCELLLWQGSMADNHIADQHWR